MHLSIVALVSSLLLSTSVLTAPLQERDDALVGYLATHFISNDEAIYQHISNGNNPLSFSALNGGNAVLRSTVGTQGARDPYLVSSSDSSEYWTIATDLQIGKTTWGEAVRHGSRSIVIWHSTDLVNWETNYLVEVEDPAAGMVWAPSAIWDQKSQKYQIFWSSQLFASDDPNHDGNPVTEHVIRTASTTDFKTFTTPETYLHTPGYPVIDQEFQKIDGEDNSFARFIKNESNARVYQEISTDGIFGTWTRVGGTEGYVTDQGREGPASFRDNQDSSKYHLWLDNYGYQGGGRYEPYSTTNIKQGGYAADSMDGFPTNLRHGSVIPVTQSQYE